MIRREPPPFGWFKLNTDGASKGNSSLAGCGGVIRSPNGFFVSGFAFNIGSCNALVAELWAVLHDLQLAWDWGARHLILELDSKVAQGLLEGSVGVVHCMSNLVWKCNMEMQRLLEL